MVLLSLVVYQPFVLLLTVIALVRGWSRGLRRIVFLSIWMFIALLLVVFMTSREMSDLAWMLIPLNAIASLELVRYFHVFPDERREVLGVILLTAFIWVFAWLGMTGINWLPFNAPDYGVRAGMMVGSLLLLALSLILVSAGWSIRIARLGGVWGLAIGLGALSLSGMFGTTAMYIIKKQFMDLRDGDRFYYENDPVLTSEEKADIKATRLADVIQRNTGLKNIPYEIFKVKESTTSIDPEIVAANHLELFPNPATDRIQVRIPAAVQGPALLVITDLQGRQHMQQQIQSHNTMIQVDLPAHLAAGFYVVNLQADHFAAQAKFIKR